MKKIILIIFLTTSFSFAQKKFLNDPLVTEIFTADPSAHIFNGKIFPMEIPRKYTFDINDNYDFQILKFLIENKKL